MDELKEYLGTNQNYAVGVQIYLKHRTEYKDFFLKNKGAAKGSFAHNLLLQELRRISYENKIIAEVEAQKKNTTVEAPKIQPVIKQIPKPVLKQPVPEIKQVPNQKVIKQQIPEKIIQKISTPKSKSRKKSK
jgi:hypothetical protein